MSAFNDIDIECEQCGEAFSGTIWTAVHAAEDPELKDLLLGGELNMVMCPECSHVAYQDHFLLYQEPKAELIAYVYPADQQTQAETLYAIMMKGFNEAQAIYAETERVPYEPVLLFGLAALVEMLREEERRAAQSQVAQEISKENNLPFTILSAQAARRLNTLRVIPLSPAGSPPTRGAALGGIRKLLQINPSLHLYDELRKRIEGDEQFQFSANQASKRDGA